MPKNITDLSGRVAVVIGGTSGLGRAIALAMAESGADVVPSGRRKDMVAAVCGEIEQFGRRTLRHEVDVARRESIDALRDAALNAFGQVDVLVNAAGRTFRKQAREIAEADWHAVMDTNLTGMLRACQSFYEPLRASGRGKVINIASLASFVAWYDVVAYNASKMGVRSITQTLAIEWARDNINVNALAPGVIRTDINRSVLNDTERGREILIRTPMRRFGKPEEVATAAVFLASDAASFITGTTLAIDGGYLCSGVNS
ncbi:MAG TPA: glucose 1-dehydrogenase [Tepidisphaeraceae bacterium]|nr:glucose 1-dehydrogenase [Tepidisphaeraceae bacterium]